jgi:hypothetical protein
MNRCTPENPPTGWTNTSCRRQVGTPMALLITALVSAFLCSTVSAAQITIICPADGPSAELKLQLDGEHLNIIDPKEPVSLAARLDSDPSGAFAIAASGPMSNTMPVLPDLDKCIAAKLKEHGETAAAKDMVIYFTNACRLALAPSATKQLVTASFIVNSFDKGQASLLISNDYLAPSTITGKPLQLNEWPMRQCTVASATIP